jgi:hypothetical protein
MELLNFVLLEFFAQGIAIKAEDIGRLALVTTRPVEHVFQQWLLHTLQYHVVDGMRRLTIKVFKVFV